MSDSSSNLPQEIISDILLRLPVKSIGRCRCVSKPWCSLLSTTQFIKSHLHHHTLLPKEQKLLLLSSSHSLFTLTLHPDSHLSTNFKPFEENLESLVGSCNGLILIVTEEGRKCLINPLTLDYAIMPNSPLALDPFGSFSMHGFGYDCLTDDYKIVTLSHYDTDNEHEPDCVDTFVDIYSVKMRSWKRFGSSPYDHAVPENASGVLLNGSLHWMGWKSSDCSVIAAFNLGSEKFEEISAPASLINDRFVFNKLVELKGCLGIVVELLVDRLIEIWFMNSYGLAESWTKITIDVEYLSWEPICFLEDKLLMLEDGENFMWYNPDDGRWDDWMVNGDKDVFEYVLTFSETLVSPHFEAEFLDQEC